MRILITVFFRTKRGGLHENVLATASYLFRLGHQATIVCPSGPFSGSLSDNGVGVIRTDYTDIDSTINEPLKLHATNAIDLEHVHPFSSRKFGLALAEQLNVPFVLTFHGKYTDDLPRYIDKVSAVLAVSSGVRDYLLGEDAQAPEKFHVVSNVPDSAFFQPLLEKPHSAEEKKSVALVSRLDKDKAFVFDVFADAVEYAAKHYSVKLSWVVVDDGTQLEELRARLEEYKSDMVQRDMDNLLASKSYRASLGAFGIKIIQQFFDFQKVHEQLLGIYRLAILSHSLERCFGVSETCDVESNLIASKTRKLI
ncbi:glycosyltransferase [Halomonas sp. AOP31-B1-25]|uniref:glycosyltransferase n=1 Tax=Halomonas sp. AOP31-B1-25 TaxID=3457694 RepID=UPI004034227C